MKRIIKSTIIICLLIGLAVKLTWSVFTAQGQIAAAQFSTGRAELYLLKDLSKGTQTDNLTHTLQGNTYSGIVPGWSTSQPLKLFNSGTVPLGLLFSVQQLSQPIDVLRLADHIEAKVSEWNDLNQNGQIDGNEEGATISDWQAIPTWALQPIDLGVIGSSQIKQLILDFRVDDLNSSLEGASTAFNFNFDATAPISGAH